MAFLPKIKQQTPAWHKARASRIGASEVSALFNIDRAGYAMSAYTLAKVKRGEVDAESVFSGDKEIARMGLVLEPVIAEMHAKMRGWQIVAPYGNTLRPIKSFSENAGYIVDDIEPRMGASLDYIIKEPTTEDIKALGYDASGPGVLQIKSVIGWQYQRAWTDTRPPEYVRIQLQQELAISKYEWGYVGVLVHGTEPKLFPIVPSHRFHDELRSRIATFWRDSVEGDIVPPIDASESSRLCLRKMVSPDEFERQPYDARSDMELNALCEDYHITDLRLHEDGDRKALRANQIIERIGKHADVRTSEYYIRYSVTEKQRRLTIKPITSSARGE